MTKIRLIGSTKDVVDRTIDEAGGVGQVMNILGLGKSRIYAFTDPQEEAQISFDQMRRLLLACPHPRAAPQDMAALAGCEFSPASFPERPLGDLLKHSAREYADFMIAAIGAADAQMPRGEAEGLLRETREAIEVLQHVAHKMARRLAQ